MSRNIPAFAWAVALGALAALSGEAFAKTLPFEITKIEGATQVKILRAQAQLFAKVHDVLQPGDVVRTESGQTVEIGADDESKIVISGQAQVVIEQDKSAAHAISLEVGKIVGWVRHSLTDKSRYRLLVKTPSAVMGVRGTQFVVEAGGQKGESTFRVLDGVVDIAKDLTGLLTDNFVVVQTGQLVAFAGESVSTVAKGAKDVTHVVTDTVDDQVRHFSKVMPFDVLGFVADLNTKLPPMFHIPFFTGEDNKYSEAESRYHLSSFEIMSQGFFSRANIPENVDSFGVGLSWNPVYHLVPRHYELRAHLGNPRLFHNGHGLFSDLEAKVLGTVVVKQAAFFEAGPMFRHFNDYGNGFGLAANTGIWFGDRRLFRLIDRFFFGANFLRSPYYDGTSHALIWEYRFGLGLTIF